MGVASRYRYAIGMLVAFAVWTILGAAFAVLPIWLDYVLVVPFLAGVVAAGIVTVKLLRPQRASADDATR